MEDPGHMAAMHADSIAPTSQHTPPSSDEGETPQEPTSDLQPISTFPAKSSSQDIPGAFPGDATPPVQVEGPQQMSENAPLSSIEGTSASPYADLGGRSSPQNSSKDDFDSAFQGFSAAPAQERTNDRLGGTISTGGQRNFQVYKNSEMMMTATVMPSVALMTILRLHHLGGNLQKRMIKTQSYHNLKALGRMAC